ncbi:MAG TPA: hypothetical protein VF021_08870 [Longimicrobiales bacterium]
MKRFRGAWLAALLLLPAAAHAQSLFSTHGLGIPIEGYDARARALGVNGVGLAGLSMSMLNPAEPAGTLRRGVSATFQPWSGTARINDQQGAVSGTRFPLIGVVYPVSRITFSLGFAGLLDQSWAIVAESKQLIGTDSVPVRDVVRSTGGIGELKAGAAYLVNNRLAVGAYVGLHTGNVDRSTRREFPDSTLLPFENRTRWDYTGPLASVGVRWDASGSTRVGASMTWSGTLKAKPKQGTTTEYEYDMPLRIAAGASSRLSNRLMVALSTTISDYGSGSYTAPGTTAGTVAQRTVEVGGGLEWSELRSGDRIFPLRLGFRTTGLPFRAVGDDTPTEWSASGGLGLRLVEDDYGPLAVADLGFERGKRTGWENTTRPGGLSESFWRFSATISLFGR